MSADVLLGSIRTGEGAVTLSSMIGLTLQAGMLIRHGTRHGALPEGAAQADAA